MSEETTEDAKVFGECFVYCKSHLRPHSTGWCTVAADNKVRLEAKNIADAYQECERKGFSIYRSER